MFDRKLAMGIALALLYALVPQVRAEEPYWIRQLGTTEQDQSRAVSADGLGNVYISGYTWGDLGGANEGFDDAFLSKYDVGGSLLWTRQLGTASYDRSYGVSADGLGNVYISGGTNGDLGGPSEGKGDAFVSKYDADGNRLWVEQMGTVNSDVSYGVSADGLGNVYISGSTLGSFDVPNAGESDAFLSKYDAGGNLLWTRQEGTVDRDWAGGVSADDLGNVYIARTTHPGAGADTPFISKYDADGNLHWSRELVGLAFGEASDVSADGLGNVYLAGRNDLGEDAFLAKYDLAGDLLWLRQTEGDKYFGVSVDGLGQVYASGDRGGDVLLTSYDTDGNWLSRRRLETRDREFSRGVSADALGNVFISGFTDGDFGGPNAGGFDAFVAKLDPIPEPSTLALLALAALCGLAIAWGKMRRGSLANQRHG